MTSKLTVCVALCALLLCVQSDVARSDEHPKRGPQGHRGHRGHRGHHGKNRTGPQGVPGLPGPQGPTGQSGGISDFISIFAPGGTVVPPNSPIPFSNANIIGQGGTEISSNGLGVFTVATAGEYEVAYGGRWIPASVQLALRINGVPLVGSSFETDGYGAVAFVVQAPFANTTFEIINADNVFGITLVGASNITGAFASIRKLS